MIKTLQFICSPGSFLCSSIKGFLLEFEKWRNIIGLFMLNWFQFQFHSIYFALSCISIEFMLLQPTLNIMFRPNYLANFANMTPIIAIFVKYYRQNQNQHEHYIAWKRPLVKITLFLLASVRYQTMTFGWFLPSRVLW